jgi:hypothetical protein
MRWRVRRTGTGSGRPFGGGMLAMLGPACPAPIRVVSRARPLPARHAAQPAPSLRHLLPGRDGQPARRGHAARAREPRHDHDLRPVRQPRRLRGSSGTRRTAGTGGPEASGRASAGRGLRPKGASTPDARRPSVVGGRLRSSLGLRFRSSVPMASVRASRKPPSPSMPTMPAPPLAVPPNGSSGGAAARPQPSAS